MIYSNNHIIHINLKCLKTNNESLPKPQRKSIFVFDNFKFKSYIHEVENFSLILSHYYITFLQCKHLLSPITSF